MAICHTICFKRYHRRRRTSCICSQFSFSNTDAGCAVIIITVHGVVVVVDDDCIPNGEHLTVYVYIACVAAAYLWADVLPLRHTLFFRFPLHIDWAERQAQTKWKKAETKSSSWQNKMQTFPSSVGARHELVASAKRAPRQKIEHLIFSGKFFFIFFRVCQWLWRSRNTWNVSVHLLDGGSTHLNEKFTVGFSANTRDERVQMHRSRDVNDVTSMSVIVMIAVDKMEFCRLHYYSSPLFHPHSTMIRANCRICMCWRWHRPLAHSQQR